MAEIPPSATNKDIIEDKLALAENEIQKVRLYINSGDSTKNDEAATAIAAAKTALDAVDDIINP